ncbi:hypothetical protein U1Q18_039100, partial [Sarracenia purpurea var. burkii]
YWEDERRAAAASGHMNGAAAATGKINGEQSRCVFWEASREARVRRRTEISVLAEEEDLLAKTTSFWTVKF